LSWQAQDIEDQRTNLFLNLADRTLEPCHHFFSCSNAFKVELHFQDFGSVPPQTQVYLAPFPCKGADKSPTLNAGRCFGEPEINRAFQCCEQRLKSRICGLALIAYIVTRSGHWSFWQILYRPVSDHQRFFQGAHVADGSFHDQLVASSHDNDV